MSESIDEFLERLYMRDSITHNGMTDLRAKFEELEQLHRAEVCGLNKALAQRDAQLAIAATKLVSAAPELSEALISVMGERIRQQELFPDVPAWNRCDEGEKLAVLLEEVGEVAKAALENGKLSPELRAELVQVGAVAVKWIESIDARRESP